MPETVLITGASGGIGRELAATFAAQGHDLVLVARSRDKLARLARELGEEFGVAARSLPRDLGKRDAARLLYDELERRDIEVDVLVNNAAILQNGQFEDIALEDHLALMHLNMIVPTTLTHLFLGPMIDRGHGRVLNVASIAAFQPLARLAVYAAAKAYLLHFTEAMSEELKGTGVTITALCPGFTDTNMMAGSADASFIPPFAISRAADVARDGYRACMKGEPVHVSGAANRWMAEIVRLQPRWLVRAVSGMVARQYR
ncbi:MAG TPA: SDR family oxidoreductase [Polyangia bacterium]